MNRTAFTAATLLALFASATQSPRAAILSACVAVAIAVAPRLGRVGNAWARVLVAVAVAHAAIALLTRLPWATSISWVSAVAALFAAVVAGFLLLRNPFDAPLRRLVSRGAVAVAVISLLWWAPRFFAAEAGDPLAQLRRAHPTRNLPALTIRTGDWRDTAASLAPLRAAGEDVYEEALDLLGTTDLPVARLVLLGGGLRLSPGNPCVSLDYADAREELAVLREDGELLLYTPHRRVIHLFTGKLAKASRIRVTPDGAGFLCLFEHGETRYFGAPSPWAATGELKYGMGRVVDFAFLEDGELLAQNAVGTLYRMREGSGFAEFAPPLFPGIDAARGLAFENGEPWMLDMHGTLYGPRGTLAFTRHAFPPPADDAAALRFFDGTLYWLDAWGGLHGCIPQKVLAFGDLAPRNRHGGCNDFAFVPWAERVVVLTDSGEILSYDATRYARQPNREAQP